MSEGFKENAIFFKLGFLDKTSVALGRQLSELFPVLWMKSGAYGACPKLENDRSAMKILPDNHMAVLIDEKKYIEFVEALNGHPEIETTQNVEALLGKILLIGRHICLQTLSIHTGYRKFQDLFYSE